MKPFILRANKKRKLEVAKGHFYNTTCRCVDCLVTWLGWTDGRIVVMSFDGKYKMVPPGSKNGTIAPPKRK